MGVGAALMTRTTLDGTFEACLAGAAAAGRLSSDIVGKGGAGRDVAGCNERSYASVETTGELGGVRDVRPAWYLRTLALGADSSYERNSEDDYSKPHHKNERRRRHMKMLA